VLPALLSTPGRSEILFEGGTHNAWAPPFDFIAQTFVSLLGEMGAKVTCELFRPGFYPAGGGQFSLLVEGANRGEALHLMEGGDIEELNVRATVSQIPDHVAAREVQTLRGLLADLLPTVEAASVHSVGPGNVLTAVVKAAGVTETMTAFGERGVRAEAVAEGLAHRDLLARPDRSRRGEFDHHGPEMKWTSGPAKPPEP
jgi:RNA 3'-terminal phosphate cyclase (ATP)